MSGLTKVWKGCDDMFCWEDCQPAPQENPETAPVLIWLQGGPGSSSMLGLFVEHGPYYVAKGGVPKLRKTTWARRYSMLYVDNPVGVGFSFTQEPQGYTRNDTDVARDLFEALQQFFTLFPEYVKNDFYVTGESYAGSYIQSFLIENFFSKVMCGNSSQL